MAKGGAFERLICKELSLWWSKGEKKDIFAKTRGSGSALKRGGSKWEGGDIGFLDPSGEPLIRAFNIECKTGYAKKKKLKSGRVRETNWCTLDIIDSNLKNPTIMAMWDQCEGDALLTSREPILIFRRFRRSTCIAFRYLLFQHLLDHYHQDPEPPTWTEVHTLDTSITIMNFEVFKEWIPDIRPFLGYPKKPHLYIPKGVS